MAYLDADRIPNPLSYRT